MSVGCDEHAPAAPPTAAPEAGDAGQDGEPSPALADCGVLDPSGYLSPGAWSENPWTEQGFGSVACDLSEVCKEKYASEFGRHSIDIEEMDQLRGYFTVEVKLYFADCESDFSDGRSRPWITKCDDSKKTICEDPLSEPATDIFDQLAACDWFNRAKSIWLVAAESETNPVGCREGLDKAQLAMLRASGASTELSESLGGDPGKKASVTKLVYDDSNVSGSPQERQYVSFLFQF